MDVQFLYVNNVGEEEGPLPLELVLALMDAGVSTAHTEQRNTSHVARRTSHVARSTSHVARHTSHVAWLCICVYSV